MRLVAKLLCSIVEQEESQLGRIRILYNTRMRLKIKTETHMRLCIRTRMGASHSGPGNLQTWVLTH